MEYTSAAKGNAALTTGIIGTAGTVLGAMGNAILGGAGNAPQYVNREAYDVQLQLIESQKQNAILSADLNTEKKIVETFTSLSERINALEKTVNDNAAAQAVINCGFNSNINLLQNQVAQLFGMTKLVIPNASVSPGWDSST